MDQCDRRFGHLPHKFVDAEGNSRSCAGCDRGRGELFPLLSGLPVATVLELGVMAA